MPEIGATLREARMRARIDVSEIEAQTKIRSRYLRALENEEWDLLPGPTFIRSFLRTYAAALGLDGRALVEEYRRHYEQPGEADVQPIVPQTGRGGEPADPGGPPGRASRGYMVTVALIVIVIVFLVIGLLSRGSNKGSPSNHAASTSTTSTHTTSARKHERARTRTTVAPSTASVSVQATETVWVCLVGEHEEKLIPGVDMEAGESSGPFHGKRFELTLGNNAVSLTVNGKLVSVPSSSEAIGYEITSAGAKTLPSGSLPTCA